MSDASASNTAKLPPDIGEKFAQDGSVLPFAGNTIVCHLPQESELQDPLRGLYAELESSSLSHLYTLLPQSSWHMTVFEGICAERRTEKLWPSDLALAAPLDECNAFFASRLTDFDLGFRPPIRMAVLGFRDISEHGISLALEPADDEASSHLRSLRDRLAQATSLRRPGHETYGFHLSIAYLVRYPSDDEEVQLQGIFRRWRAQLPSVIELREPEFCTFEDMFAFKPRFLIRNG